MMAKVNGFRLDLRRLFFYILYIYVPKSVDLSVCVRVCVAKPLLLSLARA